MFAKVLNCLRVYLTYTILTHLYYFFDPNSMNKVLNCLITFEQLPLIELGQFLLMFSKGVYM